MSINFAPEKKFQLKNLKIKGLWIKGFWRSRLALLATVGFLMILMASFAAFQKTRVSRRLNQRDILQSEAASRQQERSPAPSQAPGSRARKSEIINNFDNRVRWSDILYELSSRLPQRVVIHSLKNDLISKNLVLIEGEADDAASLATLKRSWEQIKAVAQVQIVTSRLTGKNQLAKIQFDIQCQLR